MSYTLIAAKDVRPGMALDLQGDKYADDGTDASIEFEYQTVSEKVIETPECILLHFESTESVGFPADHILRLRCEQYRVQDGDGDTVYEGSWWRDAYAAYDACKAPAKLQIRRR